LGEPDFPALWYLLKGFFYKLFYSKRRIFESYIELLNIVLLKEIFFGIYIKESNFKRNYNPFININKKILY